MRRLFRLFACLAAGTLALLLPSCANQENDPNRVSTIPWNRPERWEGQGPLGGMMNSN